MGKPTGITIDPNDNVFVIDNTFSVIRAISPSGNMVTVAGNPAGKLKLFACATLRQKLYQNP